MFLNPRDINHLLHINDTVQKKHMQILRTCQSFVFCCWFICKHVHFYIKTANDDIYYSCKEQRDFQAFFFSFLQYSDTRHLHVSLFYTNLPHFVSVLWWIRGVLYLRARSETWVMINRDCVMFYIDYGNVSRAFPSRVQELLCHHTSTHKNAHLTSERCTFINMIYFVMHTCYPACLSVCFSCSYRHLSCVWFCYGL